MTPFKLMIGFGETERSIPSPQTYVTIIVFDINWDMKHYLELFSCKPIKNSGTTWFLFVVGEYSLFSVLYYSIKHYVPVILLANIGKYVS